MVIKRRLLLASLLPVGLLAQKEAAPKKESTSLAPYYPTPESIVERMLRLGDLKAGEKMFDLGSGDGRIVILAARKFKADATGVELDPDLYRRSMDKIKKLGLESHARIILGDMLKQDYSSADVVTTYLLPTTNDLVRPLLEKQLKKGARVVTHDFDFSGWSADKTEHIDDDGEGRSHTIYVYRR